MNLTSTEEDEGLRPMDDEDNVQMIKKKKGQGRQEITTNYMVEIKLRLEIRQVPAPVDLQEVQIDWLCQQRAQKKEVSKLEQEIRS